MHILSAVSVCLQPAIYVASLAAVEKLRATEGAALLDSVDVTCGLSLGEYTALAFAGERSRELLQAAGTPTAASAVAWMCSVHGCSLILRTAQRC
jgi:malonyl CoA-acyl carrier protein transacylase